MAYEKLYLLLNRKKRANVAMAGKMRNFQSLVRFHYNFNQFKERFMSKLVKKYNHCYRLLPIKLKPLFFEKVLRNIVKKLLMWLSRIPIYRISCNVRWVIYVKNYNKIKERIDVTV